MEDTQFQITIPTDADGYLLLHCPRCGELFKISAKTNESDSVLDNYCPACGLTSDTFLSDDVLCLALAKAKNLAVSALAKELEKQFNSASDFFSLKIALDREEPEPPIVEAVDALKLVRCHDCARYSKVQPALAMSMFVCPYCGIGQFNDR